MLLQLLFIVIFSVIYFDSSMPIQIKKNKKSLIALLDNAKKENSIIVSTNISTSSVNKVGAYVELKDKNKTPSKIKIMSNKELEKRFGDVLKASPKKPISYFLSLKSHPLRLTDESKKLLEKTYLSIQERKPCIVHIIGHTDTTGNKKTNIQVSLKRANFIEKLLVEANLSIVQLNIKGYGEEDLHIQTADNVSEEKNRNVEIIIQ